MHFRDSANAPWKENHFQEPEPSVVNGGIGPFLKEKWADLAAGKRLAFNMVVPARLGLSLAPYKALRIQKQGAGKGSRPQAVQGHRDRPNPPC